jgi:hypothetical protein
MVPEDRLYLPGDSTYKVDVWKPSNRLRSVAYVDRAPGMTVEFVSEADSFNNVYIENYARTTNNVKYMNCVKTTRRCMCGM